MQKSATESIMALPVKISRAIILLLIKKQPKQE
jgi:hypothetical protein